jgi:hypothetical protein
MTPKQESPMTECEWMNKIRADRFPWMNDDQWECYLMLCALYGGDHHVFGIVREAGRTGININTRHKPDQWLPSILACLRAPY